MSETIVFLSLLCIYGNTIVVSLFCLL